jgi:peptide/nickel transport system permease protein
VSARLSRAIPVNLELAVLALVMALAVSIPLAILSAHRAGSRFDRIVSASVFGLVSVPNFVIGLVLLLIFAVHWRLLPYGQWVRVSDGGWAENLKHAFLPALTLALGEIAIFTRLLRGDMISTLREDFVLAARAKGMPTRHILVREALRPSSFSILTLAGVTLGRLIGGTVVVEQVFALPGLGRTIIDAATKNDYKLVQGGVLVIALAYTLINVLVDITYSLLDPRIRRGQA